MIRISRNLFHCSVLPGLILLGACGGSPIDNPENVSKLVYGALKGSQFESLGQFVGTESDMKAILQGMGEDSDDPSLANEAAASVERLRASFDGVASMTDWSGLKPAQAIFNEYLLDDEAKKEHPQPRTGDLFLTFSSDDDERELVLKFDNVVETPSGLRVFGDLSMDRGWPPARGLASYAMALGDSQEMAGTVFYSKRVNSDFCDRGIFVQVYDHEPLADRAEQLSADDEFRIQILPDLRFVDTSANGLSPSVAGHEDGTDYSEFDGELHCLGWQESTEDPGRFRKVSQDEDAPFDKSISEIYGEVLLALNDEVDFFCENSFEKLMSGIDQRAIIDREESSLLPDDGYESSDAQWLDRIGPRTMLLTKTYPGGATGGWTTSQLLQCLGGQMVEVYSSFGLSVTDDGLIEHEMVHMPEDGQCCPSVRIERSLHVDTGSVSVLSEDISTDVDPEMGRAIAGTYEWLISPHTVFTLEEDGGMSYSSERRGAWKMIGSGEDSYSIELLFLDREPRLLEDCDGSLNPLWNHHLILIQDEDGKYNSWSRSCPAEMPHEIAIRLNEEGEPVREPGW